MSNLHITFYFPSSDFPPLSGIIPISDKPKLLKWIEHIVNHKNSEIHFDCCGTTQCVGCSLGGECEIWEYDLVNDEPINEEIVNSLLKEIEYETNKGDYNRLIEISWKDDIEKYEDEIYKEINTIFDDYDINVHEMKYENKLEDIMSMLQIDKISKYINKFCDRHNVKHVLNTFKEQSDICNDKILDIAKKSIYKIIKKRTLSAPVICDEDEINDICEYFKEKLLAKAKDMEINKTDELINAFKYAIESY